MNRADELRAQLAALEPEENAEAALAKARERFRARPDDPKAKAAAQAAAVDLRAVRAEARKDRKAGGSMDDGSATVKPSPARGGVVTPKVGG